MQHAETSRDSAIAAHPAGHVLQSTYWARLKSAHGWRALETAHASVLLRSFRYGIGTIAYAPRGPFIDWRDDGAVATGLAGAIAAAKRAGAFALVIEPEALDAPGLRARLSTNRFVPLDFHVQPRRSIVLDIGDADENAILARMKQKTRYNIGLARRKGVTVRRGSEADAALYYDMMRLTAERDGFSIHPRAYYADFLRIFAGDPAGPGALLIAEAAGKALAALIATAYGPNAIYLYGASSNEKRELMPTYLLQWEAIRWARERGCTRYDLWGVPDEDEASLEAQFENRHDGLWGVYRFKRGFNGRLERMTGAWAYVISPLRWWAYRQAVKRRGGHGLAA